MTDTTRKLATIVALDVAGYSALVNRSRHIPICKKTHRVVHWNYESVTKA